MPSSQSNCPSALLWRLLSWNLGLPFWKINSIFHGNSAQSPLPLNSVKVQYLSKGIKQFLHILLGSNPIFSILSPNPIVVFRVKKKKKKKRRKKERKGREGKGRERKERKGKERKGKERKGKERRIDLWGLFHSSVIDGSFNPNHSQSYHHSSLSLSSSLSSSSSSSSSLTLGK